MSHIGHGLNFLRPASAAALAFPATFPGAAKAITFRRIKIFFGL